MDSIIWGKNWQERDESDVAKEISRNFCLG